MTSTPTHRELSAIFQSLGIGVTPATGLEHLVVGRQREISALLDDLETVNSGGAAFRLINGDHGSGKTFLLQLTRVCALNQDFVTTYVDLSPERRLTGSTGQGLATYRALMQNLSTRTRPGGQALPAILERWLSDVQQQVVTSGIAIDDDAFERAIEQRIHEIVSGLRGLTHGFDFAQVVIAYWRGHHCGDDDLRNAALKWMRGEFAAKTDARAMLRVRVIVDDSSWYEYVQLWARFVQTIGYRGLMVVVDECINLYKIQHSAARNANYEKLLSILNDVQQGQAEYLQIICGVTPQMVEDNRRGLYSYEALRTRLQPSRLIPASMTDYRAPVINLQRLSLEEILALCQRIRDLHALYYQYPVAMTDEELITFIEAVMRGLGVAEFFTPRDVTRQLVSVLNVLEQHPGATLTDVLQSDDFRPTASPNADDGPVADELAEVEL